MPPLPLFLLLSDLSSCKPAVQITHRAASTSCDALFDGATESHKILDALLHRSCGRYSMQLTVPWGLASREKR